MGIDMGTSVPAIVPNHGRRHSDWPWTEERLVTSLPLAPADGSAVTTRVIELRDRFTDPSADVAELLCDKHPVNALAVTAVDASGHVTTLTYEQLQERSTRCARGLEDLGVGRGDRVASLMDRGTDLVV